MGLVDAAFIKASRLRTWLGCRTRPSTGDSRPSTTGPASRMMTRGNDAQSLVERLRRGFSFLSRREMGAAAAELRTLANVVTKSENEAYKKAMAEGKKEPVAKVIAKGGQRLNLAFLYLRLS